MEAIHGAVCVCAALPLQQGPANCRLERGPTVPLLLLLEGCDALWAAGCGGWVVCAAAIAW